MKKIKSFDIPDETGKVIGQVKFDPGRSYFQWSVHLGKNYLGHFSTFFKAVEYIEKEDLVPTKEPSYVDKLIKWENESLNFFETEKFFELLEKIKKHERVDYDDVFDDKKLTSKQFKKVYDSVVKAKENHFVADNSSPFSRCYVAYAGYRWYMMHGQGTACWCEREK